MAIIIKPSLADPFLKTSRAKAHLESLRGALDEFVRSNPFTISSWDDAAADRFCVKITINETPGNITLLVGDFLYCLRCSLDQLVWALSHLTIPYPRGTQFPIFDKKNSETSKRFAKYTNGVPPDARTMIETLQPYNAANEATVTLNLLWRLNWLGNIDKHRRIPIHGDELELHFPNFPRGDAKYIERDAENATVRVPSRLKSVFQVEATSFKVRFGDLSDGIECDLEGLEHIYSFVAETVIPRFARFF